MERLLTPQELSELLRVKLSTIYKWTHYEYIPHKKVGRFLRFRESEVERWLEKRSCKGRARGTVKLGEPDSE